MIGDHYPIQIQPHITVRILIIDNNKNKPYLKQIIIYRRIILQ